MIGVLGLDQHPCCRRHQSDVVAAERGNQQLLGHRSFPQHETIKMRKQALFGTDGHVCDGVHRGIERGFPFAPQPSRFVEVLLVDVPRNGTRERG